MILEMLKAFFLIFIAEMGDKTQILAMAFATKFPVKKVLTGVFIGVLLNHGLGVIVGKYISGIIPTNIIQVVAGFAFLCFASSSFLQEAILFKGRFNFQWYVFPRKKQCAL